MLKRFLSIASLLVGLSAVTYADDCFQDMEFAADGSILRWETCHPGPGQRFDKVLGPLTFREAYENRVLSDEPLNWERVSSGHGPAGFQARDARHEIEIQRTYQPGLGNSVDHLVSVRNLKGQPLSGTLEIDVSGASDRNDGDTLLLADLVYSFNRAAVATEDGKWRADDTPGAWTKFAATERHKTVVIDASHPFTVRRTEQPGRWVLALTLDNLQPYATRTFRQQISAMPTELQQLTKAGYGGLQYSDLWRPLATLCRWVEHSLTALAVVASGPGPAIILFALVIRLVTFPVTVWSAGQQKEFLRVSEIMKPQIATIRAEYKGAEQSERILQVYREHRVSPFSGLKGSVGLMLQIPFLLAVFNVTTVSSIFAGSEFLWIDNLSLPDMAATLPFHIPMIGNHLNALPVILGIVNLAGLDRARTSSSFSRAVTAIVTLLLVFAFYSFAAALVLYWLTVNLLQAGERRLFKRGTKPVAEAL